MTKFLYSNIGEYLKYEFIEKHSINERMLARFIGVHNNRINEVIRNKRRITIDTDLRLCRFFKLEEGHFYQIQYQLEKKQIKHKLKAKLANIKTYELFLNAADN